MKSRTWMVTMAAAVLGLASCSKLNPPNSRLEAEGRWSNVRARLKCQLAAESLDKGQLDEAHRHLGEAISLNPQDAKAYVLMARILLERGETAAAAEALQVATRYGGETAETDYLNGLVAERYARFDDALRWYRCASRREPMNAHYVAAMAETMVALNRVADALALVRDRWTDFEQNATLRALAGEIYLMLGRYEEAADAYRQAVLIAPDDQVFRFQLGLALTLGGSYREAATVLSAAVAGAADVSPSILGALARCHLALGEYENAKALLRRAAESAPANLDLLTLLSQAALASDDLLTARRAASQAVRLAPCSAEHEILLAYVCWRQQDYDEAARSLETALRDAPDDLMALYLLAQCYEAKGNRQAADAICRRALRANPQCEWARQSLENGSALVVPAADRWPMPGGGVSSP